MGWIPPPFFEPPLCKGRWPGVMESPTKPSVSGFGGERRCDGVSETCPASQGARRGILSPHRRVGGIVGTWVASTPQSAWRLTAPLAQGSL